MSCVGGMSGREGLSEGGEGERVGAGGGRGELC